MSHRYCGRDFTEYDLEHLRKLISEGPARTRADLSRLACRDLHWYKADGGLKEMSARVAMLRMEEDGLLQLPPPSRKRPDNRVKITSRTDPQPQISATGPELAPLEIVCLEKGDCRSGLWNEYIQRYHYLGHKPLPGAQLRYLIYAKQRPVALLGFGASAWQTAPRDHYIGWTHEQRKKNLHLIVNNARFLILPWVESKNLASMTLSMIAKRLPDDWQQRYHYRPVLLETFVEKQRFDGTCYKASNWIYLGETKGRGKLGPAGKQSVPIKGLWIYPLERRYRTVLTE